MARNPPKTDDTERALDARESRFVDEYLADLNTERAAVAAGYSITTAKSKAYQWVSNGKVKPHVYAEVMRRRQALADRADITAERVLREIAKIGYASMRRFIHIDEYGQPQIDLTETPSDDLDALSEIATETVLERDGTDEDGKPIFNRIRKTKIKLHDKLSALEKLAQHTGVYKQRDEDMAGALARAITDIQERTSRAPIRRDTPPEGDAP